MISITIFLGLALAISAAMFAIIGLPLLRADLPDARDDRAVSLGGRLFEIERARLSGLIGEAEAAEASIEAQRAALSAPGDKPSKRAKGLRFGAIAFLVLAPVGVLIVYLRVGSPGLIATPRTPSPAAASIAAMPEAERLAMIDQMVSGLAARLKEQPHDAEGWRTLARSQLVLRRADESAASYRRLLAMEKGSHEDWRNFAMALTAAEPSGEFPTSEEFTHALDEIENRRPDDPMALFWRGGVASQKGDAATAAATWSRLLSSLPSDAPIRPTLEALIGSSREKSEKDVPD